MRSRWILAVAALLVVGVTAASLLTGVQPPAWLILLLGSLALALLYIVARLNSRFDPSDPHFGSCIPPISKPGDQ